MLEHVVLRREVEQHAPEFVVGVGNRGIHLVLLSRGAESHRERRRVEDERLVLRQHLFEFDRPAQHVFDLSSFFLRCAVL